MFCQKLYIFLLLCLLPIHLSAERIAKTTQEKELVQSVREDYTELSEYYITKGIPVDITDNKGYSLLMYAVQNKNKILINLLVEHGADVNYSFNKDKSLYSEKTFMQSVLDFAITTRDVKITEMLVDRGAKLDIEDRGMDSRIVLEYKRDNLQIVEYFLKNGAKLSQDVIRNLLIKEMLNSPSSFYDNQVNFWRTKLWDDYGFSIDVESLLSSPDIKNIKDRKKVIKYIAKYQEWLQVIDSFLDDARIKKQPLRHNGLNIDKPSYAVKPSAEDLEYLKEEQDEEAYAKAWFILIIVLVLSIIAFYQRKYLYLLWHSKFLMFIKSLFSTNKFQPLFSKLRNIRFTRVRTTNKSKAKARSRTNDLVTNSQLSKIAIDAKGWAVDNTIEIEVNYLTIEDMINPIAMCNEHEKAVREMIWYIRRVEKQYQEDATENLSRDECLEKLNALWARIDPHNVRTVYIRSLYVLIENYSENNKRLKKLLKTISKSNA